MDVTKEIPLGLYKVLGDFKICRWKAFICNIKCNFEVNFFSHNIDTIDLLLFFLPVSWLSVTYLLLYHLIQVENIWGLLVWNSTCLLTICEFIYFANHPEFSSLLVFSMICKDRLTVNEGRDATWSFVETYNFTFFWTSSNFWLVSLDCSFWI